MGYSLTLHIFTSVLPILDQIYIEYNNSCMFIVKFNEQFTSECSNIYIIINFMF